MTSVLDPRDRRSPLLLNAVAQLQLESRKISQLLFEYATNKNHHNYVENHIKSIST